MVGTALVAVRYLRAALTSGRARPTLTQAASTLVHAQAAGFALAGAQPRQLTMSCLKPSCMRQAPGSLPQAAHPQTLLRSSCSSGWGGCPAAAAPVAWQLAQADTLCAQHACSWPLCTARAWTMRASSTAPTGGRTPARPWPCFLRCAAVPVVTATAAAQAALPRDPKPDRPHCGVRLADGSRCWLGSWPAMKQNQHLRPDWRRSRIQLGPALAGRALEG